MKLKILFLTLQQVVAKVLLPCIYQIIFILNMLVVVLAVAVVPYLLPHDSLRTPTASVVFIVAAAYYARNVQRRS
jgi:hypothetical protein